MKIFKKTYISLIFVLILSLIVIPEGTKFHNIKIEDMILGILLVFYLLDNVISKGFLKNLKKNIHVLFSDYLNLSILLLILLMGVSVLYSTDKKIAISETIRYITYGLLYLAIIIGFDDKYTDLALRLFIMLSGFISIYGLLQFFTGIGVEDNFKGNYSYGAKIRIDATFGNPDSYGAFLIICIFPILSMAFKEKKKKKKYIYSFIALLLVLNVVFTGSRNALLGLMLGLLVFIIYEKRKLILPAFVLFFITLLIPIVRNRLLQVFDATQNQSRIKIWKVALKMIKDHPIIGVGNGNFYSLYNSYITKYPNLMFESHKYYASHNSYLKIQSELGIPGIIIFVLMIGISITVIYKFPKIIKEYQLNTFYVGYFASMIAFYFMNIFDNLFFVPKVTTFYWILLALMQGALWRKKQNH